MSRSLRPLLVVLVSCVACHSHGAVERWGDRGLPVRDDSLAGWWDATRVVAARAALGWPGAVAAGGVDRLPDASGNGRHLRQAHLESRPRWQPDGGSWILAFDGQDDLLHATVPELQASNVTLFVVARPRANPGGFRGFFGASRSGANDYTSGFNLDLGGTATPLLARVNAEGAGFAGEQNLLAGTPAAFGAWHVFSLVVGTGAEGVGFRMDGLPQGSRRRTPGLIRLEELVLGGRFYSNTPDAAHAQGAIAADIVEVVLYRRALTPAEQRSTEAYLRAKHARLLDPSTAGDVAGEEALVTVTDPPPVRMLVPGFEVTELPVRLSNLNNLRYRPDGRLYAAGYDGRIWLLSDSDGDGLEDRVEPFWTNATIRVPIGMAVTRPDDPRGDGVFLPSIGKLSLLIDTNRDGRADREIVCTTWDERSEQGNVDALGCAVDAAGNVYFGLGAKSYLNGHQVDAATGRAGYSRTQLRGTIQKLSPDFQKRETVCTGIRFSVGLAFNRAGDLFATDQEGATWLPNGNPLDELLHIIPGRHYGYPPWHPRHLPDVVDEPSVYDYAPQHQSTCGLTFNEPVNGGPVFGPADWAGDALVAGESRGKLWRTQLVKTPAGYVARTHLLACLRELAIDGTVSPRGDLLVCTHSGRPDWGSGPLGAGHIYRIRFTRPTAPQPALVWSASPTEIRVAFDRPLDPASLRDLTRLTRVTAGRHVMPGDRYETIRPGYQVVNEQMTAPRFRVPVLSVTLDADQRTLAITTAARHTALNHAVILPNRMRGTGTNGAGPSATETTEVELLCAPQGIEATWEAAVGGERWQGWLPHADTAVARAFTRGSARHEVLWPLLGRAGQLTLRGQLDLGHLLHPVVQPGSRLDYTPPAERATLLIHGAPETRLGLNGSTGRSATIRTGDAVARLPAGTNDGWLPVALQTPTGPETLRLGVTWTTERQPDIERPLAPWRWVPSWVKPGGGASLSPLIPAPVPELAGGNWLRGRRIFHGANVSCFRCHAVRGEGGHAGPDLSNLVHRDYASVLRDIREPNAALNPDFLAYNLTTRDGDDYTGTLRPSPGGQIILMDATGRDVVVPTNRIQSLTLSAFSLMPEGLDRALSVEELRDLMTFLLRPSPLEPALIETAGVPPARSRTAVRALVQRLAPSVDPHGAPAPAPAPLRVVLVDGPKDHGPGEHDYPQWRERWSRLLSLADGLTVETAHRWPSATQFEQAQVICFFNNNPGWNATRAGELDAYLARGGGAVYFHWAVEGRKDAAELAKRIGLASDSSRLKYRHGPIALSWHDHPLTRDLPAAWFNEQMFVDETYWDFTGDPASVHLVASAVEDGAPRPQIWTREVGKGRVFVSIPGHYNWTFDDPAYRLLAFRGISWAAGQPMDRLVDLIDIGARLTD